MHPNSTMLFQKYALPIFKDGMRVLEIAPDGSPSTYQKIIGKDTITWETLQLGSAADTDSITYIADDEYSYSIPDNTFDVVFCDQVAEHVKKIWLWTSELSRICKVGGYVIIINPVSWNYHEAPVDCWRIYPEGMKALYEQAGLTTLISKCESLHLDQSLKDYPYLIPGLSYQTKSSPIKSFIKRMLKIPIIYTLDTVTIGTKQQN